MKNAIPKLMSILLLTVACNNTSNSDLESISDNAKIHASNKTTTSDSTYYLRSNMNTCENPNNDTILQLELSVGNDTVYVDDSTFLSSDASSYGYNSFMLDYENRVESNGASVFNVDQNKDYFWIPLDDPTAFRIISNGVEVDCYCPSTYEEEKCEESDDTPVTCLNNSCYNACCAKTTESSLGTSLNSIGVLVNASVINYDGTIYPQ